MTWAEKLKDQADKCKAALESVQGALSVVGKILWVVLGVFVAIAIGTGHPVLLGTLRDRLILAGVTSLKTPWGVIDPKLIGQVDAVSRALGVTSAIASELADSTKDSVTKEKLVTMAKELKKQQNVQIETLNSLAEKHKSNAAASSTANVLDAEGWLFLGRRSDDKWRPASFSINEPAYPVKPGEELIVRSDALLYGSMDCKTVDAADFQPNASTAQVILVKASQVGVPIITPPTECPASGGAKMIWAKVRVPPGRVVIQ